MKIKIALGTFFLVFVAGIAVYFSMPHRIPIDADRALTSATSATLYSLDPSLSTDTNGSGFHKHLIVGQIQLTQKQTAEMASAIKNTFDEGGIQRMASGCLFEPNRALRITTNGIYDFLLNANCDQLEIYYDDKNIAFLGDASASGSRTLKALMDATQIPPSGAGH